MHGVHEQDEQQALFHRLCMHSTISHLRYRYENGEILGNRPHERTQDYGTVRIYVRYPFLV